MSEPEGENAANPQLWQKSIDQANVNYGYAENRRMNLELEREYGRTVWMGHLQQAEDALAYTQGLNAAKKEEIEGINKKRRFS